MPKNNKVEEEVSVEVTVPEQQVPVTKIFVRAPRTKVYSFDQWAKFRNRLDRHMGGMKAFLGSKVGNKYSLETWDEMMKAY